MASVTVIGTEQFREFALKCREAGTDGRKLRREIQRALKDGAKPVVEDARSNVMALASHGGGGAARAARTAYTLSKRKKPLSEHAKFKVHLHSGLRASAARATKVTVSASGASAKAEIKVDASLMPAGQRRLPKHMNTGHWRHPVMGNRKAWVTQTVTPGKWFTRAMEKGGPKVRDEAFKTVQQFLERF